MKSWEIVESIREIGFLKTYEILRQQRLEPQPESSELSWEEIVERNKRNPVQDREAGEEG